MQYWINITKKTIALSAILFSTTYIQAQENSPYSRYGLGNIKQTENVSNRGMGGVSIADDNSLIANPTNPATYTGLKMTSYQFSVEGSSVNIKNATGANRTGATSINYVNIGLALSKKLGMSFGLLPQTRSKYQMQDVISLPNVSQITRTYYGGGGLQKIYIGAAYKIKDISLGFNTGYNFGNITNTTESEFTDTLKILSSFNSSRYTMGGVFWQVGALMNKAINKDYTVNIGFSYTGKQSIRAKRDQEWGSYLGVLSAPDYSYKIDSSSDQKGKIIVPANLGVGFMLKNGDYWQVGADFTTSNWSNYSYDAKADSTNRTWYVKVGGSITPDVNSVNNTFKRMTYRIGAYHGQDIFRFNNEPLTRSAITAGFGYPIRRTNLSIGQINFALEIGSRGTTNNGLVKETYKRFCIGLTLNDKWFVKRKYD
jgi:hypothetical protein